MPHVEAVILAGGRGTRLSGALPGIAKVLAPVKGRPFLDYVLEYLVSQGVSRIVLSVGHLQQQVIDKYRGFRSAALRFSTEPEPLGTGGAVWRALDLIESDPFLVLNGDSLCRVDLSDLVDSHRRTRACATLALVYPDARTDVGNVWLRKDALVVDFAEKSSRSTSDAQRFTNAGVYAFSKSAFTDRTKPPFSLESDVLPRLVAQKLCFGFVSASPLVDIGTPARLAEAQRVL